jgi:hypothetical protein
MIEQSATAVQIQSESEPRTSVTCTAALILPLAPGDSGHFAFGRSEIGCAEHLGRDRTMCCGLAQHWHRGAVFMQENDRC